MSDFKRRIKSRDKHWDLIRAVGIVFVVLGHNYQPAYIFFPAFYFQVSIFFFISGYFFKPQTSFLGKAKLIYKKTETQLLPYLLLNLFFGIFTMWLKSLGINLGADLNFETMFIMPFSGGDQFNLYLAAWFLFNLYFINVVAALFYVKDIKKNLPLIGAAIIFMLIFLIIGNQSSKSIWMIFLIRSAFGFGFFSLGYLFHQFEKQIQKVIIHPYSMIFLYLSVNIINVNFGNVSYTIVHGNINNQIVIVPVISSLAIILFIYAVTYYAKRAFKPDSFIYQVGQYSYAIMVWHLTVFFLINLIFYQLSLIPFSSLSQVFYKYQEQKFWLIYQIPAIVVPVLMAKIHQIFSSGITNQQTKYGMRPGNPPGRKSITQSNLIKTTSTPK